MESKVKSMLVIFFDIREIVLKEFVLAGQTVNSAFCCDVTVYGDCVRMCEDFAPNFRDKGTGCCITTHRLTLPFSRGNFCPNQHYCRPYPLYCSLFFRLKVILKGRHFDTIEVMEAESQALLNVLTGHDFQDAFKQWQKC
jgi:hypothetical protein